jgi:SH3-like domain-containing protein
MRIEGGDLALRARPADGARAVALLAARATAEVIEFRGDWRRITVDHASGWVRSGEVWGGSNAPQCEGR